MNWETVEIFVENHFCKNFTVCAAILLFFYLIYQLIHFIKYFIVYYFFPGKDLKRTYGEWALVTGATDGIGLGYAKRLAARGINIILVSRSQDKLSVCAKEIAELYHVETDTVAIDMSRDIDEIQSALSSIIAKYPIGILINNVGVSYDHAMYLTELPEDRLRLLIHLNCEVTTAVTRMMIPGMIERKKGAIINIASAAGIMACGDPLYAVYSASKAFVDFLSRSLQLELKEYHITVECHAPYYVPSKLSKIRKASLFCPPATVYAEASLNKVGRGCTTVVPFWGHQIQHFIYHAIPFCLLQKMILSNHKDIRKRALRKKELKRESCVSFNK